MSVERVMRAVVAIERDLFDCCIEVAANVRGEGDVGVTEVGGGEYATAVHRGPFDRLAETYAWLALDFMPREGRSMRKAP